LTASYVLISAFLFDIGRLRKSDLQEILQQLGWRER